MGTTVAHITGFPHQDPIPQDTGGGGTPVGAIVIGLVLAVAVVVALVRLKAKQAKRAKRESE